MILVVDPDERMCQLVQFHFRNAGNVVLAASTGEQAVQQLRRMDRLDLVLLELRLPGMSSLETLRQLTRSLRVGNVIVMALNPTVADATAAMREGAYELVNKTSGFDELHLAVRNALQSQVLQRQVEHLQQQLKEHEQPFPHVVGRSQAMAQVLKLAGKARDSDITVLLTGESGVGKEVIAQAIHSQGLYRNRPFVAINCAAIPENLLESELFGHEKGAFTGAIQRHRGKFLEAHDGTLFLDEVGELSLALQAKLLRALQTREIQPIGGQPIRVKARIISASNQDLEAAVQQGRFRLDLYHRLAVFPIVVPPLRERREDIPQLAKHFLVRMAAQEHRGQLKLHPEVMERMLKHTWNGNVRELENMIYRAVVLSEGTTLALEDFPVLALGPGSAERSGAGAPWMDAGRVRAAPGFASPAGTGAPTGSAPAGASHSAAASTSAPRTVVPLDQVERQAIISALQLNGGNVTRTAIQLKIGRATLYRKFKQYRLRVP